MDTDAVNDTRRRKHVKVILSSYLVKHGITMIHTLLARRDATIKVHHFPLLRWQDFVNVDFIRTIC
jgi:hypothetical protein